MSIFEEMRKRSVNRLVVFPDDGFEEINWVCESMRKMGHEKVILIHHPGINLIACIAIHDGTLGRQRIGGVRFYPYEDEVSMITDALQLSATMTKKASMANLDRGGAKANIWGDPRNEKTNFLLHKFAEEVNSLGGEYIAAEDMGISVADLMVMRQKTSYVCGLPATYLERRNGRWCSGSGEPGPVTAKGVVYGIKACLKFLNIGNPPYLYGKTVAVQGLGSVGFRLARYLHHEGAKLIGCDADPERVRHFQEEFSRNANTDIKNWAKIISPGEIYSQDCDIFSPCAKGGVLDPKNILRLKCKIVAGSANNPLASEECGNILQARGILYAPDFVINAGGLMNVDDEQRSDGYDENRVLNRMATTIQKNLFKVFLRSKKLNLSPNTIAEIMARERIEVKKQKLKILAEMFELSEQNVQKLLEKEEEEIDHLMKNVFK